MSVCGVVIYMHWIGSYLMHIFILSLFKCSFNPLVTVNVNIPHNAQFVIAKCLREHHLAGSGGENHYNERVAECRLGANILYKVFCESNALVYNATKVGLHMMELGVCKAIDGISNFLIAS